MDIDVIMYNKICANKFTLMCSYINMNTIYVRNGKEFRFWI